MFSLAIRRAHVRTSLVLAAAIAALAAPQASAAQSQAVLSTAPQVAIVAESLEVCDETGDVPTELSEANATLRLPRFDPAVGVLKSANLTIYYSATTRGMVTNYSPRPIRYQLTTELEWRFSSFFMPGEQLPGNLVLDSSGDLGGSETINFGPITSSDSVSHLFSDASFAEGTDPLTIVASTITTTYVSGGGGNSTAGVDTTGQVRACMVYEYLTRGDASISVQKSVSPSTVPAAGGTVTYTYAVDNTGSEPATIAALSDDKLTLPGDSACKVGTVLPGGGGCTFTVTTTLPAATGGSTLTNTFSVTASNGYTNAAPQTATATVTYLKPPVTTTAQPTQTTATTPAPSPSPSTTIGTGQQLAATGLEIAPSLAVGLTGASILTLGAVMLLVARRRPSGE